MNTVEMTPTRSTSSRETASAPACTALKVGQDTASAHRSMTQEMVLQATSRAFTLRCSRKENIYRAMATILSSGWLP